MSIFKKSTYTVVNVEWKSVSMNKSFPNSLQSYNTMTILGKGQVTAIPDIAVIHLGVQTTGENLEQVQSENAQISQAILQAMRQLGIEDIQTHQYTIEKLYSYVNEERIDKGYSVRNVFRIRLDEIAQAGTVIDTAVANGANLVEFISFEVSNPDYYYQQALNMAVMNAVQKAQSIAMQLRVALNPIPIQITETSAISVPYTTSYNIRERAFATPIEPGTYQIEASITAEFAY